ncbi:MAG: HAD family hydrolase [Candidatus Woesearchaeota archaeon]|nr:HAD family hydrolase [Candidatus Woesearchaeota archaeon]
MKIKVISFDLDNCLTNTRFDDVIWFKEIPKAYAEKNHISFKKAHKIVYSEYTRLKGKTEEWRDIKFWLSHFKIRKSWKTICSGFEKEVRTYRDVMPALLSLRKKYKIAVISHAERNFLELKVKASGLFSLVDYSFSSRTELLRYHKEKEAFLSACKKMKIKPSEIVHVGDNEEYDYIEPMKAGIKSFIIDRSGKKSGKHRIKDLRKLEKILEK